MFTPLPDPNRVADRVLPVSALNRLAREALEQRFPLLWVSGEISNLMRAASGHCYFSLKDENAQVRCVMFRNRAQLLPFELKNGAQVEARVLVSLYEPRGDFQLNVEALRQAGMGSLFEAFLRLREKLTREGLFDESRKRPLPPLPQRIGIITSLAAAALRDVLAALKRRAPHVQIIIYPTPVQGEGAGTQITRALMTAGLRRECDVLILTRGGGSIEDLWAFNDEALARAIAASPIPVVAGVGHETDFTIADFAADLRAATPTAAAELVTAGHLAASRALQTHQQQLNRAIHRQLEKRAQALDLLSGQLQHPKNKIELSQLRLNALKDRLARCLNTELRQRAERLSRLQIRLTNQRPDLALTAQRINAAAQRLPRALTSLLAQHRTHIETLATHLTHLDPNAILRRGYSIVRTPAGQIVKSAEQLQMGETIEVQFAEGAVRATVETRTP